MDLEGSRVILVGQIETLWAANWSGYDLFFENLGVGPNFAEAKALFAEFRVEEEFTRQATIGDNPITSSNCVMYLNVYVPKGKGTKVASAIHKSVKDLVDYENFTGVVVHNSVSMKPVETKGWYVMPLRAPYHFSSIS